MFEQARGAFVQQRTFERARLMAISSVVGLGRKTITGMLCASFQQFTDWSAAYRLFERHRFSADELFVPVCSEVLKRLSAKEPLVVMMDDTLLRKRGRKVHGAGWRRDPLGPPFRSNFVWAQRFVQVSAALPEEGGRARTVPVDLTHAPSAPKPGKRATEQERAEYRARQEAMKVSRVGAARLAQVREKMDAQHQESRSLIVAVDGGYTNKSLFRNLPHDTVAIGRIRKDARLFHPPAQETGRGRRRFYGQPLATPEEIRKDESIPWTSVNAFAAGKSHSFDVKTVGPLRWRGSGSQDVRLVVVRPLAYRLGSKLLYRQPSYLLCTDPQLSLERLLQSYLWRWEIELNFRDEKTLLGVGQAQVRTPQSVANVPALMVLAYACLLLAGTQEKSSPLPLPKWRKADPPARDSTAHLISRFRSEMWGKALGLNLEHFAPTNPMEAKPLLFLNTLPSAVLYADK